MLSYTASGRLANEYHISIKITKRETQYANDMITTPIHSGLRHHDGVYRSRTELVASPNERTTWTVPHTRHNIWPIGFVKS